MNGREQRAVYSRNFIFGVEDGLVSTVGLLSGIAAADIPRTTIILTGIILIMVEALSMAAGSFLSESSVEEYLSHTQSDGRIPAAGGLVMFVAYVLAGFVPLAPYILFVPAIAFPVSIILTLGVLFALGVWSARIVHLSLLRSGLRMLIVGGLAVAVGILIGGLVK